MRDQQLYNWLVDAFSMRAFLPTPAVPTGHDEFFAAFDKFGAVSGSHFVDMTIDQLRRYDSENVQYVEFMVSSWCPDDRDRLVKAISETTDDASKLKTLEASGLGDCVAARRNVLTAALGKIRSALACDAPKAQPGCGVTFRYIIQVNRNNPPDEVFVQTAIAAALIRAEPRVVALNFVGPEDGLVARRDYTRHMQIIRFLANDVPVALHAGELWLGLVPPPDLAFHIREAIEIAGARRIGHGVALAFERDMEGLLAEMRTRPVVVEVNLTSTDLILGVRGKDHPLPTYLAAGVPVVLFIRRCRDISHRPHQRIPARGARFWPRVSGAEGDRPQRVDLLLPRRGAKARRARAVRPRQRRIRALRCQPAIAAAKRRRADQGRRHSAAVRWRAMQCASGSRVDGDACGCRGGMATSR